MDPTAPIDAVTGAMGRMHLGMIQPDPAVMTDPLPEGNVIDRDPPDPTAGRASLVSRFRQMVSDAKQFWDPVFQNMRDDMDFAKGVQWVRRGRTRSNRTNLDDETRYVANIVHRHVQQKVSGLYARNPRVTATRKERLLSEVWDGTNIQVQQAMQMLQMDPANPTAIQILKDFNTTVQYNTMMDKVAKTLELVYAQNIAEQEIDFKTQMKGVVRRSITTGVAYARLGFQRVMKQRPDIEARISDYSERLAYIERVSAAIADGEAEKDGADAEQLRLAIAALKAEQQILLREGLTLGYPESTAIIPDPNCRQLRGFVGCDWVAEEYVLTPEKIEEIYKVDVSTQYTAYSLNNGVLRDGSRTGNRDVSNRGTMSTSGGTRKNNETFAVVWEIYNRTDGLVYVLCDGYPDFLQEPAEPDVWIERFWPWFVLALNEIEHYDDVYPLSDVRLIKDMQLEINRARQGLREQRIANRPKMAVAAGLLDDTDIEKLKTHPANSVLELTALQPGQRIEDVLQAIKMPGIDPNLYDVSPSFQDIERTVGVQEANLGGGAGGTATESSIAESSRMTQMASNIDDINDFLTEIAQTAGQILLSELSSETAKKIAGPAAVWPELTREEIADEIELEVEAGSTGRPNQSMEIANAEKMMPLLMQIPGISPEYLAKELGRRMDDKFDMSRAFTTGLPSITAMNSAPQAGAGGPPGAGGTPADPAQAKGGGKAPTAQGAQGAMNAPNPANAATGDPMEVPPPRLHDYVAGRAM